MEQAKIAIIEDHKQIQTLAASILRHEGHDIVFMASSRKEALLKLSKTATDNVKIDVVLVDGQLDATSRPGEDARVLYPHIKKQHEETTVVGFSAIELPSEACDYDAGKNIERVVEFVRKL